MRWNRLAGILMLTLAAGQCRADPELLIAAPVAGQQVRQLERLTIVVRSARTIDTRSVLLSVEGSVAEIVSTPAPWKEQRFVWNVGDRAPGEVVLRVSAVATSGAKLVSQPVRVVLVAAPTLPAPRSRSYALLVGAGRFEDPGILPLAYTSNDVQVLYAALADPASGAYPPANLRVLADDSPDDTLPSLVNVAGYLQNWLAKVGESADTVILYFSGHVALENGRAYLLVRDSRLGKLAETAVDLEDVNKLLARMNARARIVVAEVGHGRVAKGQPAAMSQAIADLLFVGGPGRATLAGCTSGRRGWKWPAKGQGVFTHYLAEGLRGAADANRDRRVTLEEAASYAERRASAWAAASRKTQQVRLEAQDPGEVVLSGFVPGQPPVREPGWTAPPDPTSPVGTPLAGALHVAVPLQIPGSKAVWAMWLRKDGGCAGNLAPTGSNARVTVTKAGKGPLSLVVYSGIALQAGQWYSLLFRSRAEPPRRALVGMASRVPPHLRVGLEDVPIALSTTWEEHRLVFQAGADPGDVSNLTFQLGDMAGTVWIEGVTLTTIDEPADE